MTDPSDPSIGPHLSTDAVSDLLEGVLPPAEGRVAAAHLERCRRCQEVKNSLVHTHAVLGESGRTPPPIPPDVFSGVEASLRAESAQRAQTTGVSSMSAARERRRARWPTRILAAAAALAVLGGAGVLAVQLLPSQDDADNQAGSVPERPDDAGEPPRDSADEGEADDGSSGLTAANFDDSVRSHLDERGLPQPGSNEPSFGDEGPDTTLDPATTTCVSQLLTEQGAGRLLQADETTFDGDDVVLAITTAAEPETVHGYAIDGCDTDEPTVVHDEAVQTE